MAERRVHLFIRGRVQGVNFRYYTMQKARELEVSGWVRNLWDGRVEAVAEGDENQVNQLVKWCHHGPPSALVEDVEASWEPPTGEFTDFLVRLEPIGE